LTRRQIPTARSAIAKRTEPTSNPTRSVRDEMTYRDKVVSSRTSRTGVFRRAVAPRSSVKRDFAAIPRLGQPGVVGSLLAAGPPILRGGKADRIVVVS
jgi:hypothetical protein